MTDPPAEPAGQAPAQPPPDSDADWPAGPREWEADVVAADGGTVHLRPIRPSDADALVEFHGALSQRTRYLRYFSAYPRMPARDLYRFTHVDHVDRVAFVVLLAGRIIAVGRYERMTGTDDAEVAFVVADAHQGRGIGSVLLEHLAAAARERGLQRFIAIVLAENNAMIRVFRLAGYETTRHVEYGEVTLEFNVAETGSTEAVMREREQRAEARSISRLLHPRSVAVVGASTDPDKIGNAVFRNLLATDFDGPLYPVNSDARHVGGVRAYPSVLDVPDDIDLAVIAVPAAAVGGVVADCAQRGVRGLVVISGGFGERGSDGERDAGRRAQQDLLTEARDNGMRVVGPNCLGLINTAPDVQLNASLAPLAPLRGRAGFFSQSGALGVAVLGEATRRGIGVSTFVSAGNRVDVSGNDLMQYWETDDATDVVLMYLESFGNPRKFARLARRLGRRKPIIAVKGGATMVVPGLAYTSVEVPETSVRALFERSGVIRVETVGDMFDVALLLTSQPLPRGRRVAVVGNSTALGALVTNALAEDGLRLARLDDIGVAASAAADALGTALRDALADPDVDAAVVVFVPPLQRGSSAAVARQLRAVAAESDKPVVSTFLGYDGVPPGLEGTGDTHPAPDSVPSYPSPERAVRALGRATRYAAWRERDPGIVPVLDAFDAGGARRYVSTLLQRSPGGRDLEHDEAAGLLRLLGIELAASMLAAPAGGVDGVLTVQDDRSFGALVSFGLRGVATELLGDRAYATVPVTTTDADELIAAPRAAPLLDGWGGGPTVDRPALAELAMRLSAAADALPEITECTLGVTALSEGFVVTTAQVWVGPASARPDTGPRRLRGM